MIPGINGVRSVPAGHDVWAVHGLGDLDHAFSSVGDVNYLGAVFGVIFSGIFILHEKEHRTRYVIFFCGVFALIIALLLHRSLGTQDDDTNAKVLGYFADVMVIIMSGPPLRLMGDVIKTKNSEIIAAPMVNGALWTTYGIMQTDYYVLVPNAISDILRLVQVILVAIFPRSLSGDKKGELSEKLSVDNDV
ncbi:SWEET sugar transporter [Phytophthora cactorum]|nr:SWEET sugar transporter [Phytophthora cactorum]